MYDLESKLYFKSYLQRGVNLTLADMKENDCGIILYISNECEIKRRLFDMGFIKGNEISCVRRNFLGSPIAYKIEGSVVALRKNDAQKVGVVL